MMRRTVPQNRNPGPCCCDREITRAQLPGSGAWHLSYAFLAHAQEAHFGAGLGHGRATASALPPVGGEVALVDGAGVTTEEGDAVGTAVGCGALLAGAELAGLIRAVGAGVAADRDGEGSELAGAADRAGGGETVARPSGRTYR
jgi:hypothetical protein